MADDMARAADSQTELDMKELCGKFSMETIATCAFGVNAETFSNSDSQFVQNAKAIFRSRPPHFNRGFRLWVYLRCSQCHVNYIPLDAPKISTTLRFKFLI